MICVLIWEALFRLGLPQSGKSQGKLFVFEGQGYKDKDSFIGP